ncbi:hypothetical protein DFS34DRAFT_646541 [Phlyctochytrium arcticum]|nr:hypothetical protein DFS34DRAFT_646541 [Phlyctochytrium arcticum]
MPGHSTPITFARDAPPISDQNWRKHPRLETQVSKEGFIMTDQRRFQARKFDHFAQRPHRRLVWETWKGPIPGDRVVHHMDGNASNNALDKLAVVTPSDNARLAKKGNSNNISGYNGVHWCNVNKKWQAAIWLDRKRIDLGFTDDILIAAARRAKVDDDFGFTMQPEYIRGDSALVPEFHPLIGPWARQRQSPRVSQGQVQVRGSVQLQGHPLHIQPVWLEERSDAQKG